MARLYNIMSHTCLKDEQQTLQIVMSENRFQLQTDRERDRERE